MLWRSMELKRCLSRARRTVIGHVSVTYPIERSKLVLILSQYLLFIPDLIKRMLLCFSIIQNFKAIFNQKVGSDTVPCIHGLRTISMGWVILGHLSIIAFKYSQNYEFKRNVEKEFLFQTILNGQYSVDTFFFISGFLISFLYFRTNAKGKLDKLTSGTSEIATGVVHFFGLIAFRFIRLTVPYLFVLGLSSVTMKYFEQYSVFEPEFSDQDNCPKYWIRNVFYINTFFPVDQMVRSVDIFSRKQFK